MGRTQYDITRRKAIVKRYLRGLQAVYRVMSEREALKLLMCPIRQVMICAAVRKIRP